MSSPQAEIRREAVGHALRHTRRDLRWVLRNELDGSPVSWGLRTVATAALATLPIAGLIYIWIIVLGDAHVPFVQLWVPLTTLLTALWIIGTAQPAPLPEHPTDEPPSGRANRPFTQVDRWAFRLSATEDKPDQFATVVRDRIASLVATRLSQRHGVQLFSEPERARAILGEELHHFLTGPVSHSPSPTTLSRLIHRIEEL